MKGGVLEIACRHVVWCQLGVFLGLTEIVLCHLAREDLSFSRHFCLWYFPVIAVVYKKDAIET